MSAYALVVRRGVVLLSQLSDRSTQPGMWTLPGGGLDHGEDPLDGLRREVREETGLYVTVGALLDVHSLHHEGVAPDGVLEDFHALRIVYDGTVALDSAEPQVVEEDGTTAAAAWLSVADVNAGRVEVAELVTLALAARERSAASRDADADPAAARRPEHHLPSRARRIEPLHPPADPETVFTYGAPQLKYGSGASTEIGYDLAQHGVSRVLVVTDAGVAATGIPDRVAGSIASTGIDVVVFDRTRIEPTDESLQAAVDFTRDAGPFDAYVAVGGGSSIDTAKAVNLLTTNPGELMDYVNAPVGHGRAPSRPLKPLVAVPTTTGTGSESTTVCVLDVLHLRVKTGISHYRLRPTLAVIDPDLTLTQPAGVTASSGMDIVCHALESYTARSYASFERKRPDARVPYCGANPIADMWAEKALALLSTSFRRAVRDGTDRRARSDMALAATFAGLGFGNAGVHLPHANAYPIAGRVRDFRPPGYPDDEPMVPHGMAVSLTAPAAFRFTFSADPERHLRAAALLDPRAGPGDDPAGTLSRVLVDLMRDIGIPPGIAAIGYDAGDVNDLVRGALQQQRLLATAPLPVTEEDLAGIFADSLTLW